jgi:hypothetical protein
MMTFKTPNLDVAGYMLTPEAPLPTATVDDDPGRLRIGLTSTYFSQGGER